MSPAPAAAVAFVAEMLAAAEAEYAETWGWFLAEPSLDHYAMLHAADEARTFARATQKALTQKERKHA